MDNSIVNDVVKALISFFLGGGVGCLIGIKIGVNKTIKQHQKSGDHSTLAQIGVVGNGEH